MSSALPPLRLVQFGAFCTDPVGNAAASDHALVWFPRPDFRGAAYWGSPTIHDLTFGMNAVEASIGHAATTHCAFTDVRHLQTVDAPTFAPYFQDLVSKFDRIARKVTRTAVLVQKNQLGALIKNYRELVTFPYEARVFDDAEECFEWLGMSEIREPFLREMDARIAELSRPSTLARDVRRIVRERLLRGEEVSLDEIVRLTESSARSVQRAFSELGSSFRDEARKARVERAMHLLATTDMKLSAVALEVGFQKLQNLNEAFEAATLVPPREWRKRHRAP